MTSTNRFFCLFLLLSPLFLLFLSSLHSATAQPLTCGAVYDGSTPLVDIDRQSDTQQLRATWTGFFGDLISTTGGSSGHGTSGGSSGHGTSSGSSGNHRILRGSTGSSTGGHHGSTGSSGSSGRRGSSGSSGRRGGSTGGTTGNLPAVTFQVAIISEKLATKAITSSGFDAPDRTRCRSTAGFNGKADVQNFQTVLPDVLISNNRVVFSYKSGKLNLTRKTKYFIVLKVTNRGSSSTIYSNSNGVIVGVNGTGSDDDDGVFPPYKAGLIAMGIAIFCLLCCLLLIILLVVLLASKKEDKYGTTVHRNENVDKL